MQFTAPAPGTYRLQRIQVTPDAHVLDSAGRPYRLSEFLRGKITLLTFFYTYCADPLGCPFAHSTLSDLRARILQRPGLAANVRFVNVTLDPTHDTPATLREYAADFGEQPRFEWRFLTTSTVAELLPILDDFGQDVSIETDERGRATRTLHHMLKVFLVDAQGTVREIYSLAFLQPDVIFNDIRTLAMETRAATHVPRS
jgi:cytochrome oxidase Cu insertion factor (SCO1/SenC/PrrC family)